MNNKMNLFTSIFSLISTSLLLVVVALAWYATNNTAKADNAVAAISDNEGIFISVKAYSLADYEGAGDYEYTVGSEVNEMVAYGDASSITATLLEIEYSISEASNDNFQLKIDGEDEAGIISHDEFGDGKSYLSNAVNFTKATVTSNNVDLSNLSYKINKASSDEIVVGQIDLTNKEINTSYYEYIVVDYDTNLVNDLYTALLQSSNKASLSSAIEFIKDLSIILS